MKAPKITEGDVLTLLQGRYGWSTTQMEWVFFGLLRTATGYRAVLGDIRTMDGWALNCWPSNGFRSIAFEVKVSKSDFKHELDNPKKREPAMRLSNQFYFVAPRGLIAPMEIPEDCGLIVVQHGELKILHAAPMREREDLPMEFVASILRDCKR